MIFWKRDERLARYALGMVNLGAPRPSPPFGIAECTLFDVLLHAQSWRRVDPIEKTKTLNAHSLGWSRSDLRLATHRFVLDSAASAAILSLAQKPDYWFEMDIARVRLPSKRFWTEWTIETDDELPIRQGILVSGDDVGLSGSVIPFFQTPTGAAGAFSAEIQFDWTHPMSAAKGGFSFRHCHHPCLDDLLRHALIVPIGSRRRHGPYQSPQDDLESRGFLGAHLWHHIPMLHVFLALLEHDQIGRAHLESAGCGPTRAWTNRRSLIADSMTTRSLIYLGAGDVRPFEMAVHRISERNARRRACKAHAVRGHFVTRGATTYWRSSHVRGDKGGVLAAKVFDVKLRPDGAG